MLLRRCYEITTPQLNGKVERSHLTDKYESYQLLSYTDDDDLNAKLEEWKNFYNFNRPHGSFKRKTPYKTLKSKLNKHLPTSYFSGSSFQFPSLYFSSFRSPFLALHAYLQENLVLYVNSHN